MDEMDGQMHRNPNLAPMRTPRVRHHMLSGNPTENHDILKDILKDIMMDIRMENTLPVSKRLFFVCKHIAFSFSKPYIVVGSQVVT